MNNKYIKFNQIFTKKKMKKQYINMLLINIKLKKNNFLLNL